MVTVSERAVCAEIRRAVFVGEQGLFDGTDHDVHDDDAGTIHIAGLVGPEVVGTVRIYRVDDQGLWRGDRLAVRPGSRRTGIALGQKLVRCAVATAGQMGGVEMIASVQLPNVLFFERLGWRRDGDPAPYHGVDHQTMLIGLSAANSPSTASAGLRSE